MFLLKWLVILSVPARHCPTAISWFWKNRNQAFLKVSWQPRQKNMPRHFVDFWPFLAILLLESSVRQRGCGDIPVHGCNILVSWYPTGDLNSLFTQKFSLSWVTVCLSFWAGWKSVLSAKGSTHGQFFWADSSHLGPGYSLHSLLPKENFLLPGQYLLNPLVNVFCSFSPISYERFMQSMLHVFCSYPFHANSFWVHLLILRVWSHRHNAPTSLHGNRRLNRGERPHCKKQEAWKQS